MRRASHPLIRIFTLFVMVLSLTSMSVFTAAAAPANPIREAATTYQSAVDVELCAALLNEGLIDANGDVAVDAGELETALTDLVADGVLDLGGIGDVAALVTLLNAGGCQGFQDTGPEPGHLTVIVLDADGNAIGGATVAIDGAETGTTNPDGSFTTTNTYAPGNYAFSVSAPGYEPASGVVSVEDGNASTPITLAAAVPDPAPGTLTVVVTDEAGNPVPGALITFDNGITGSTGQSGDFTTDTAFDPGNYPYTVSADGYERGSGVVTVIDGNASSTVALVAIDAPAPPTADVTLELCQDLDADGNGIVDSDEVAALAYDVNDDGVIDADDHAMAIGECNALLEGEFPTAPAGEQGTVNVSVFLCSNIAAPYFETVNPEIMVASIDVGEPTCVPGSALFSFYLIGDGTAEFEPLSVDGSGSINLDPGQYQIVEEATQASITIDVVAGAYTSVVFNTPSDVPAEPTENMGTVNVSVFYCDGLDAPLFLQPGSDDAVAAAGEDGCAPGQGLFTFTLMDDVASQNNGRMGFMALQAAPDFFDLNVQGSGSIGLGEGTYEVMEANTGATTIIDVAAGANLSLIFQTPTPADPAPNTGTVNVSAFYCDNIDEPTFQVTSTADVAAAAVVEASPNCAPGSALFTFYLVGDGTAENAQLAVDGAGSIALGAGRYEVVEENTQARVFINVYVDESTNVVFLAPASAEPAPGDDGGDTGSDTGSKSGDSTAKSLPSTGSGQAATGGLASSAWMLMLGAAVVSAVGFQISRRQTNS